MTDTTKTTERSLQTRIKGLITYNEEPIKHPYLDNKGKVTIGAGFLVDTEDAFAALDLQYEDKETGARRPATEAEKRAGFRAMRVEKDSKDGKFNQKAPKYKHGTDLRMPPTAIEKRLDEEIDRRLPRVRSEVGAEAWDKLTDAQKASTFDIAYANGSLEEFPKLKQAIRDGDAEAMARESHFHGGDKADGGKYRNWKRIEGNHCGMLGLEAGSPECRRSVGEHYRKHAPDEQIPPLYRQPADGSGDKDLSGGVKDDDLSAPPAEPMARDVKTWSKDDVRSVMEHRDYGRDDTPTGKARFEKVRDYYALDEAERRPLVASERTQVKADPDWEAFRKALLAKDRDIDEIAMKPVRDWTEDEQRQVGREVFRLPSGDPRQTALDGLRRKWFEQVYGTDRVQFDDFGRMKEPRPKVAIPTRPRPIGLPDGHPMADGLSSVARLIRDRAGEGGVAPAVRTLQGGLNLMEQNRERRMDLARRAPEPLAEDGVMGPRTRMGIKRTLAQHGPGKLEEGFALGAFRDFAQGRDHRNLAQETERTFGPLFRNPKTPLPATAHRPESGALQQTLNDLGSKTFGSGWEQLKEDGWIGPKTTSPFSRVAKGAGVGDLVRSFGRALEFF